MITCLYFVLYHMNPQVQAVADWIGRSLATSSQWPRPSPAAKWGLLVVSLSRYLGGWLVVGGIKQLPEQV